MIKELAQLVKLAKMRKISTIAVAQAANKEILSAVVYAKKENIADAILIGDKNKISIILTIMGENPEKYKIVHEENPKNCAKIAVNLVREKKAHILVKGDLPIGVFLHEVTDKSSGICENSLLSHIMLYEVQHYPKLLCVTDGAVNAFPNLALKTDILKNALEVVRKLGNNRPICACVCATEMVENSISSTVDAQKLSKMKCFDEYNATILGPVGLDLAINLEAVASKNYSAQGAGYADILMAPNYEVANVLGKAIRYFGKAKSAGIIVGAKAPIVLVSRADNAENRLFSIALASLM